MNISLSRILLSGLFVIALILAACSGSGTTTTAMTTTETLEEILAQAIDVEMVKYDCVYIYSEYPEETRTHKVWFKENKMKIETSYEGQVEVYLLDKDTRDVYRWVSPENEPRETGIAPGEVSDFVSAMTMAEGISFFNPTIIGSENLDGKDCLVVEYVVGAADDITIKAWLWKEKRFLVRQDLISSQGTTTIEFRNIDFGDIPDSVFELPAPIITSPTMTLPSTDTTRVTFPDANLEAAIRDTINKPEGLIYIYNLESFTMLEAAQRGISVLNGLEYCVNLKYLNLGENNISDISVLDGLTNLQTLSLFNNNISDISRLAGLTNLENLHLANNNISDISALAGLTNLTNLILSENDLDLLEGSEDMADIKALQDRGTTVTY